MDWLKIILLVSPGLANVTTFSWQINRCWGHLGRPRRLDLPVLMVFSPQGGYTRFLRRVTGRRGMSPEGTSGPRRPILAAVHHFFYLLLVKDYYLEIPGATVEKRDPTINEKGHK